MKIEEALKQSPVNAAYKPWELIPENTPDELKKFIVVQGEFDEVYVIWAHDFTYIRELLPQEAFKLQNRPDEWEPVGKKVEEVQGL
jgi:hypothetical protein